MTFATGGVPHSGPQQKSFLMKVKEREKVGLRLNIQKTKIMASSPIHFIANRWGNNVNSDRLHFGGGSKITADGDCSHEIKRRLLLGRQGITNLDSILKCVDITLSTRSI